MNDSSIKPFVWGVCTRVLPLVYDDALSYNDLVNKMINKVNELIGITNELILTSERVVNTINELVREYFDSEEYHARLATLVAEDVEDELDYLADWATLCEEYRKIKIVAGVLRKGTETGGEWHFIGDNAGESYHSKIGFSSVSVSGSDIKLTYNFTVKNILGFSVTPDEAFLQKGIFAGASVGTAYTILQIWQRPQIIGGKISYNGSSWDYEHPNAVGVNNVSISSTGTITITHDNTGANPQIVNVSPGSPGNTLPYIPALNGYGPVNDTVSFYNHTGEKVRTPDTNMIMYYSHITRTVRIAASNISDDSGDFWVLGVFEIA